MSIAAKTYVASDKANENPTGWRRYVYSTNHKDIGTMYLVFGRNCNILASRFSRILIPTTCS